MGHLLCEVRALVEVAGKILMEDEMKIRERKIIWEKESDDLRIVKLTPVYAGDRATFVVEKSSMDAMEVKTWHKYSEVSQDSIFWKVLNSLK
jgi:hypothetical protein